MSMDLDWTVSPRTGLGRLVFGMSTAEVEALSGVYGAGTGPIADRIPDDILRDTLEKFGSAMTDEEKQALIAMYAEIGPSAARTIETRGEPGLVLAYEADRLDEIMTAKGHHPLFLDGQDLLSLDGRQALTLLERLNGGPGRYAGTAAMFDELAIAVVGFSDTDGTDVTILAGADDSFRERTVTLRPRPYQPAGEDIDFITHSVRG